MSAVVNRGAVTDTATLKVTPVPHRVNVTLDDYTLTADGESTTTAHIHLSENGSGDLPGQQVTLTSDGDQTFGPVHEESDGSYTATVTSSTKAGSWTLTATSGAVSGNATSRRCTARPRTWH